MILDSENDVEAAILAGTFPHTADLYVSNSDHEHCGDVWAMVRNGNCIDWMAYLAAQQTKFSLIFADPPFNIGQAYDVCDDKLPQQEFHNFNASWINVAKELLKPGGILAINIPSKMLQQTLACLNSCGRLQEVDHIIWHYRFGNCIRSKFISSKTHILVYKLGTDLHTWNPDAILVDSLRKTKYNDARIDDYENGGTRVPFDVWDDIPRVVGNARERQGMESHPNQLPEKLLERVIKSYTNAGDWCFDPFGGTGTTSAVAAALSRNALTVELSTAYYHDIVRRLLKVV